MGEGPNPAWDWEGHSRAQAARLARLPLWEKLAWLEEAHRLLRNLKDARARRASAEDNPTDA